MQAGNAARLDGPGQRDGRGENVERQRPPRGPGMREVPFAADCIVIGDTQEAVVVAQRSALGSGAGDKARDAGIEVGAQLLAGQPTRTPFQNATRSLISAAAGFGSA